MADLDTRSTTHAEVKQSISLAEIEQGSAPHVEPSLDFAQVI
jgi:hypothetical protein